MPGEKTVTNAGTVGTLAELWSSADMGQGPGSVAWLTVDRTGTGQQNIVQLWNNGGQLGMIVYEAVAGGGYAATWTNPNMGQGAGAVGFLTVDMNGDRKTEIVQLWNNGGALGMIVYAPTPDGGYATSWTNPNMGQGPGAVAWLTGEQTGDGKADIFQLWNNGGSLGIIAYSPTADGGYATAWSSPNMGQGPGAVAFFTADANGDGQTEIIQLWNNSGALAMIVYAQTSLGGFGTAWSSPNMGQGAGAIGFYTGDIDGDKKTEIIQLWNNNGKLGTIVYAHNGSGVYSTLVSGNNISANAMAFLTGDLTGDGKTDLIQLWDNGGVLGLIGYSFTPGYGFDIAWSRANFGTSSAAVQFLTADVNGDGKTEVIQLSNNSGSLGMTVYGLV